MPAVFSPGEAETRPLHPEAIVYTNAQKVADLLGIGPGEAVLVGADSATDGVFVTGNDFREHGFSAGDTIFIYSDDDPLGIEKKISAPTTHTTGVKLPFESGTVTAATYTVAKNTYVQNTASFTDKRRGVTKAHVEQRIKEIQDRIDNYTHNAWRPYLVVAEYINFDTYKPYRRRYFTDYVGTAPLLFRNVQQILRIEMWQGENYREIGSAEARIEIINEDQLAGEKIYLALSNGSIATLEEGSDATNKWRADFDKVSTAQNLADLINREDRVSKTAVEFTPTFTLEGSTDNIAVHNEALASANSDYGNGKLKVTSMRQTKGGEGLQIAATDLENLQISQTANRTTTTAIGYYTTGLTAVSSPLTVASYPAPDTSLTVNGYLGSFTTVVLQSGANNPASSFTTGQSVFTAGGALMGVISSFGGAAGGYQITFAEAIPSGNRPGTGEVIHDFLKVLLASTDRPIANAGYLSSGDSSPIHDSNGDAYGTVVTANDSTPALTFSSPVAKLSAGATLFNQFYLKTTGSKSHTFSSGDKIYTLSGTEVATFSSFVGDHIRVSTSTTYTGALAYPGIRSDSSSTEFSFASTDGWPKKGIFMIVNGTATRVFSYTGVGADKKSLTGVAVLGGSAALTQLDTEGVEVSQYFFQSDIGAFSDAGGDQGRLKDWWLDHEMGIIYFNNSYPFFEFNAIKASYIYGERYLEKAIEEAATKLVAVDLIMADDRSVLIPEGSQNITLAQKAEMWKKEANSILTRYKEVVVFE